MSRNVFRPEHAFADSLDRALLACFAAAALALCLALASSVQAQTCIVLSKEGRVEAAKKGAADWSGVETNQVLQVGDRVRTGLRSRATLQWSDLSVLRLNAVTSIELEPPEIPATKPKLNLKSGAGYFFNRERAADVQFRTPVASGAIRGTEFHVAVAEDGRTVLTLVDGLVDLQNPQGSLSLQSGQQALVEPGKAPVRTAAVDAVNVIQWVLYYPAVLDPDELRLPQADQTSLSDSLQSYRAGNLLKALDAFPDTRTPVTDAEKAYRAQLLLVAGQVDQAVPLIDRNTSPLAQAVREMIAAVKNQSFSSATNHSTASEWLAHSYYLQAKHDLENALVSARQAVAKSPNFGAAWIRVAELEFSFGRAGEALKSLDRGLQISPANAQGIALRGFLLSAENRKPEALKAFDQAIALDPALANAWLGRGLARIRLGHTQAGRADLQVAATLEPQRSVLRSYLGKAFSHDWDQKRAEKEFKLAQNLDPNDPTPWLYEALLDQQENRLNNSARELQRSKELNQNRSLFRSGMLLDQDQAVRSANLAAIYRDLGMTEVSVREAARAVSYDYGNHSAHLFLAESYDALRDPKLVNLRYETPWFSELLLANLLAPVGANNLSQNISQQEYSRFFEGNQIGLFSDTEYWTRGSWIQRGSQYGTFGNTSYALDVDYRTDNGWRPNNDYGQLAVSARLKHQFSPKDSVYFEVGQSDVSAGDVAQYYNQNSASRTFRVNEKQVPTLLAGYHHEWSPGHHTLFLAGRFDDSLTINDSASPLFYLQTLTSPFSGNTTTNLLVPPFYSRDYKSTLQAYSGELQQIATLQNHTLVAGARVQQGWAHTESHLRRSVGPFTDVDTNQVVYSDLTKISVYGYDQWRVFEPLLLTAGLSYDRLYYPRNIDVAPITDEQSSTSRLSPKAGLIWTPIKNAHLRAAYTRSLGGVFFDNSVRLEPTQIAGFNQAYRSIIPESVVGLVPGTRFETWDLGLDYTAPTDTYLGAAGQILKSRAGRTLGAVTNSDPNIPIGDSPSSLHQSLNYEEKSILLDASQLIDRDWTVGARYRMTHAHLEAASQDLPTTADPNLLLNADPTAILHQVNLYTIFNHPCGFYAQFNSIWSQQSTRGLTGQPGDDFWQHNLFIGQRLFARHADLQVGLLNLTDRDYHLHPLTLYADLPRERTLTVRLKWYF
ncbi:MAG: repeat protein [Verrucomicrobiales bacterium]|nr:repeat protein [Verrucomicrobiales bacterium]